MSTVAAPRHHRAAEHIGYHLALHPRLRWATTLWLTTHTLFTCAVLAAPPAAAATLSGALNWTGITDSHHVPIGNYYLSVVSTSEAITKAGPGLSADPASWAKWLGNAITTGVSHETICGWLQCEAAIYVFVMAIALWLLKFAMSNTWLAWLATWMKPLFATLQRLLADMWFFPLCLVAGLAIGAFHLMWHGRRGHGTAIMLSTFAMGALGMLFTGNGLDDLASENGLIAQGRNLGFTLAQAGLNNGPLTTGGTTPQLQHLTGLIADATVRMPLQLMNFGKPIDNIGSCGQAYTNAMLTPGDPADAAHRMVSCGAGDALKYAQHLSGENLALGGGYALLGAMFAAFVCYVTYSYVMVCSAAFINALLSVAAAGPAMVHGRPRQRAIRRFTMMFKHAWLVFAYTTYISVVAMILLKMASVGGYADQIGMTHPLARLLMVAITSVAAIGVFRWLKHELGDHTREGLTHTATELHRKGRDGYQRGQDTLLRGQQGLQRARDLNARAPWSKSSAADNDDTAGDTDNPITGKPVPGRPPGGRPTGAGRIATHQPTANPGPATSGPAVAASTTPATPAARTAARSAATAAGDIAAPEVIAAVAASRAARTHLRTTKGASPSASTPPRSAPAPTPVASPTPAAGRSTNTAPAAANSHGPRRTDSAETPQPHSADPPPTDQPVQGR